MSSEPVVRREVAVLLPNGLHLRPMSHIVRTAGGFPCEVTIANGDRIANAKSQLDLMGLQALHGTQLVLEARGENAAEALAAIIPFFEQELTDDERG